MGGGGLLVGVGMNVCLQSHRSTPHAATSTHQELFSRVGRTLTQPTQLLRHATACFRQPRKGPRGIQPCRFSVVPDLGHLESRPRAQVTHHVVHNTARLDAQPTCGSLAPIFTGHGDSHCVQGPRALFARPTYQCYQFWEPGAEGNMPLPGSCPHTERPALSSAPACPLSCSHATVQPYDHCRPRAPDH